MFSFVSLKFKSILASIILSEKVYKKIFLSVILGFLGVFVLLKFPFIYNVKSISVQSLIIALSGAFLTALAYVLVRLASKKNESPFLIMFYFDDNSESKRNYLNI